VNWAPFAVCEPDQFAAAPRGINTAEGLGDRLRVAAFAELQAREAFRWAADTWLDATVPQRAAWRRIADDEHRHLEMLLGRMRELGVKPEARIVSDRLWRSLRACKTTAAFAAYMKTAEERGRAAEESFRRQFAERDPITSAIFGKIADDEAKHIAMAERAAA
jgi:uncharacterized ferritin-like protein (DUF455 family)